MTSEAQTYRMSVRKALLDPRTKLLLFLASSVVSLNLYGITSMVVFSSLLCLLLALCGRPGTALKAFLAFAVVAFLRTCMETQASATTLHPKGRSWHSPAPWPRR